MNADTGMGFKTWGENLDSNFDRAQLFLEIRCRVAICQTDQTSQLFSKWREVHDVSCISTSESESPVLYGEWAIQIPRVKMLLRYLVPNNLWLLEQTPTAELHVYTKHHNQNSSKQIVIQYKPKQAASPPNCNGYCTYTNIYVSNKKGGKGSTNPNCPRCQGRLHGLSELCHNYLPSQTLSK